eukprot:7661616-Pyramimonas_sp.AAC.1
MGVIRFGLPALSLPRRGRAGDSCLLCVACPELRSRPAVGSLETGVSQSARWCRILQKQGCIDRE